MSAPSDMTQISPRRKRKIEKRRQEILAAAKELFLQKPYLQVTVDEIADAADIAKATIYSHFKNKIEIYSAITLRDAEILVESLQEAHRHGASISANLHEMGKAYVHFFLDHPEYLEKLSWFYFPGREKHLSRAQIQAIGKRLEAAQSVIANCLTDAIQRNEIKNVDVHIAAQTIYLQWFGIVYLATAIGPARRKHKFNIDKSITFACAMQLHGLALQQDQRLKSTRSRKLVEP